MTSRIYYFEPQPEGHTEVKKIRVDRHGELMDIWPNGFFSERDSELFLWMKYLHNNNKNSNVSKYLKHKK